MNLETFTNPISSKGWKLVGIFSAELLRSAVDPDSLLPELQLVISTPINIMERYLKNLLLVQTIILYATVRFQKKKNASLTNCLK